MGRHCHELAFLSASGLASENQMRYSRVAVRLFFCACFACNLGFYEFGDWLCSMVRVDTSCGSLASAAGLAQPILWGLCWDNRKEYGNYYNGLYRV